MTYVDHNGIVLTERGEKARESSRMMKTGKPLFSLYPKGEYLQSILKACFKSSY